MQDSGVVHPTTDPAVTVLDAGQTTGLGVMVGLFLQPF